MIKILMVVKAIDVTGVTSVIMSYFKNINRNKFHLDLGCGEIYDEKIRRYVESQNSEFIVIPERDKNIIKYISKLSQIIKDKSYDIVHVHGNSALIFPELLAAKIGGTRSEPDKGISDAFNKGIQKATGDVVGLINAGDCLMPQSLSKLNEEFRKDYDIIYEKTFCIDKKIT